MLAILFETNKTTSLGVKTPNRVTETMKNERKVLQGDVLAPLISSNMVDKNIVESAIKSKNVYFYKKQTVEIPPLMMQNDTLGISEWDYSL